MSEQNYRAALEDFRNARRQAALQQLLARFTGKSTELLAYNDVSDKLQVTGTVAQGLREIPLEAIVGSVGRAEDFTRDFLPKHDSDAERWARVKAAVMDMKGWSPIDVYKVGEVYFVKDGNHRVSVARQLGADTITAHVTEVKTKVPLELEDDPQEVICKAYYLEFLSMTRLDETRPGADLRLTFCEQYPVLLAQIEAHQARLAETRGEVVLPEQAAACWYDDVYLPLARLIREQGIMRNFSERTETDIYVLLSERHEELEEALGWTIDARQAVFNLAPQLKRRPRPKLAQLGGRLLGAVAPELEEGPPPGTWRQQQEVLRRDRSLFGDILVSLQGTEADWQLLDEAIRVARWEHGRIRALHAVDHESELESTETCAIEKTFFERIMEAGVEGEFAAEVGVEGKLMIKRAAWVDLVATNLTFATEPTPLSRISSGVNMLIQRCPRPILVLTGEERSPMDRPLLAYDGSPKADEALYVAAYLAARWEGQLSVVTVETEYTSAAALERARDYLTRQGLTDVTYILRQKPIADAVLETAVEQNSDLLVMGGFGFRPLMHLVLGSTVDTILRTFSQPILICR